MLAGSPVQRLRPRSAGRLLDGGFDVVRFRPQHVLALIVVTWLPVYVVSGFTGSYGDLLSWLWGSIRPHSGVEIVVRPDFPASAVWGVLALTFGEMLTGVGIAFLVGSWLGGDDPDVAATLRHLLRRLPLAIATWLVALIVKGSSAALVGVGLLLTAPAMGVLAAVVSTEGGDPFTAIRRSFTVTSRNRGMTVGLYVLGPVLGALLQLAIIGSKRAGLLPVPYLPAILAAVVAAALTAWRASVWALVLVDSRVVAEGLDLRLELARVMP
jgi:hypothetical protein